MVMDSEAQAILKHMRQSGMSLSQIAGQLQVNKGLVHRGLKGYHSPTLRHALDLPPLMVLAQPCRACGEVHMLKRCNRGRARRRRMVGRDIPAHFTQEQAEICRLMALAYSDVIFQQVAAMTGKRQ